jgi:alpha-glucosidase (family GH31 glycosyl hydrolase)
MWGSCLLISPVLDENQRSVYAYFPDSRWFDYYTGKEVEYTHRYNQLDAPLDYLPLHIKGGCIIVKQESAMNTELSRKNSYSLSIAPTVSQAETEFETTFYNDDGDSISN